jgi:hypothetical protein
MPMTRETKNRSPAMGRKEAVFLPRRRDGNAGSKITLIPFLTSFGNAETARPSTSPVECGGRRCALQRTMGAGPYSRENRFFIKALTNRCGDRKKLARRVIFIAVIQN